MCVSGQGVPNSCERLAADLVIVVMRFGDGGDGNCVRLVVMGFV